MKVSTWNECVQLVNTVNDIENGKLNISDLNFEALLGCISEVYGANGEAFQKMYGELINSALSKNDIGMACNIISMCAQNMLVIMHSINDIESSKAALVSQQYITISKLQHSVNENYVLKHSSNNDASVVPFTGKGVVFSALFGDYDDLHDPLFMSDDLDYVFFTNNRDLKSDMWKIVYIDNEEGLSNAAMSRKVKMLPWEYLPDYDYGIYIDGKMLIKGDVSKFVEKYRRHEPWLAFPHYSNDCIYSEAMSCKILHLDDDEVIDKLVARYEEEGFPHSLGLTDNAAFVRDFKDERVRKVCTDWWNEYRNNSKRDQLSFRYVCWKNDFCYDTCPLFIYDNEYFGLRGHKQ